jgi:hypothetical protein
MRTRSAIASRYRYAKLDLGERSLLPRLELLPE